MDEHRFLVGLIGSDLGSSLSPSLSEREADELGVRCWHQIIDLGRLGLGAEEVGDLVSPAGRLGFAGLNVTHPAKRTVVTYLDEVSAAAAALGAVDTVVFNQGRAIGHNTEWSGFAAGFRRGLPDVPAREVVLLGAGGTGTAVAFALVRLGVRELTVVDDVIERAERLAVVVQHAQSADQEPLAIEVAHSIDDVRERLAAADGLVNTVAVGMSGVAALPVPAALLTADLWVADTVDRPLETELLTRARAVGCRTLGGGGIVVAQAAEAFALITGLVPDSERMHRHFGSLTSSGAAS